MTVLKYKDPNSGEWIPFSAGGSGGTEEVAISDTEPVDANIELWVDRDDATGANGWDAFDARYVNTDGDTMTGNLTVNGKVKATWLESNNLIRVAGITVEPEVSMLIIASDDTDEPASIGVGSVMIVDPVTQSEHAATKAYVDSKAVTISASAPASPYVGQLWATP